MKNKKLGLIIVFLSLIVLLSSVAYAQLGGITRSPIAFFLINLIVIAFVLFILQSFLLGEKTTAGQRVFVIIGILMVSVVVAFIYGRSGYIWKIVDPTGKFFTIYVLVNTVVLSAFLYFLLQFAPIGDKFKAGPEKVGAIIMILILSAVLCADFSRDEQGNGQFIWQTETVKKFMGYLFGETGILTANDNRIFIFITATILLTWIFNMFITGEGGPGTKLNFYLALILAANMASGLKPTSLSTLFSIGKWVLAIAIFKGIHSQLSALGKYQLPASAAIAYFISSSVYSVIIKSQTVAEAVGLEEVGTVQQAGFGSTWVIAIIIFIVFWFFSKEKEEGKKGVMDEILRDGLKLSEAKFKKFLRTIGIRGLNLITQHSELRDSTPAGEVPYILRDLRVELEVLMNYMLRLEVFAGKESAVRDGAVKAAEIQRIFRDMHPDDVPRSIHNYKIGPDVILEDNKFKLKGGGNPGWSKSYYLICRLMNEFNDDLNRTSFDSAVVNEKEQLESAINT